MRPFNLEEYLKNPSQKVITRDGRDVRIVCTDVKSDFPVIALVCCRDNKEDICTYHKNGHILNEYESPNDLVFAPVKKEGWVNIYKGVIENHLPFVGQKIYKSKEDAIRNKCDGDYLTTIKIEWEE